MFKFLTNTIILVAVLAAIGLAIAALLATAICFSVLLGGLTAAVHLLADKNAPAASNESVDPVIELASLGEFSIVLFRVFSLIIKENASRLKYFASDWAEGGASLFAHCFEAFGLTQTTEMYKKVIAAAVVHSWAKKEG